MKTLKVCFCASITLFQLASSSLEATCGDAQLVQVSNETRINSSLLHFPWVGVLYSIVNKTIAGDNQYLCGVTLIAAYFSITGTIIPDSHFFY